MRALPTTDNSNELFTADDAINGGWTTSALRYAVRSGRLRRVRRGVFVAAETESEPGTPFASVERREINDALAAARTVRTCIVSHRSAALIHGLPVLRHADSACVTVPGPSGRTLPDLHVHRGAVPAHHIERAGHARITNVPRTVIDLAREHGFDEAVVAGDAALRGEKCSRRGLFSILDDCHGWPGTRSAKDAVAFCDARSESVLVSLSRVKIRDHNLPQPDLQTTLYDANGRFVARVDFLFVDLGVVGEADGLAKYAIAGVDEHEQTRRQRIENLGYGFVRWQASDLCRFDVIAERIRHTARHLPSPPLGSAQQLARSYSDPWGPPRLS